MTIENMSTVMNEGVKMCFKAVTENLFKVVGPIVEPISIAILNPKGSLEASLSIGKNPITVTYNGHTDGPCDW